MQNFTSIRQFTDYLKSEYDERIAYRYLQKGILHELSYHEFMGKIDGMTAYFHERGITRKPIALIGKTSYEWASTYLAVLSSNNIVVLLDPNLLPEQKEDILNRVDTEYVFTDDQYIEQREHILQHCQSVKEVYNLTQFVNTITIPATVPDILVTPEDLGQYMFTSGTTGQSKAVMSSYRNITSTLDFKNAVPLLDSDVILSVLPIHHCFELTASHLAVYTVGGTICINDKMEHLADNINRFQPNIMFAVPAIVEEILRIFQSQGNNVSKGRLRKIVAGGAKMRSELPREFKIFGIQLANGFGMTEMCGHVALNNDAFEKPDSVGIPSLKNLQIKLADDDEILLKGNNTMIGYYNIDNSPYFTEDGFLKTGDLGKFDEDGFLFITGRKKNVIILNNGENIYPEELEAYLVVIPLVRQAVVFEWNSQIAAMIYPNDKDSILQIDAKILELNRKIATYKRITKVFYRETPFPSTSSGKIKRGEFLKEINQEIISEYIPPETELEKRIAPIIKEVLRLDKDVSREDDFFYLGGNSLTALALSNKLNITAQFLYENPVLKDLAKGIHEAEQEHKPDESYINELIQKQNPIQTTQPVKNIFLTGASGFLGAHLLWELAKQKDHNIVCLVRNKEKMKRTYQKYFKQELPVNVELLLGDITKDNLGLLDTDYTAYTEKIDTVIHAAANVHHVGNRDEFMKTNYRGTEQMIAFCKMANATLHYISSYVSSGIGVVPIATDTNTFNENMLYIGQDYTQNIYVHTKYLSEVVIIKEREHGLKANIYRVGCLTSRRKDCVFQINKADNGLRNRLKGMLKAGIYTEEMEEFPVDFTPVDDCAEAIVKLIILGKLNCIYHMFNPNTIHLKDLGNIFATGLKKVTKETFDNIINNNLSDKEITEYAFYNTLSCNSEAIQMECDETIRTLKTVSFAWNLAQNEYIQDFIS